MVKHLPSYLINGEVVRQLRLQNGWTQKEFALKAGYSERLIRKAELGGCLRFSVIEDLAECLSDGNETITFEKLVLNPLRVAKLWTTNFDIHGVNMLEHVKHTMDNELVFRCGGSQKVFPFDGEWHGIEGHQRWLNAFFHEFERVPGISVTYSIGDEIVSARWLETVKIKGVLCPPVQINFHFFFRNGFDLPNGG